MPAQCESNNKGRQKKCHLYKDEVLPYDDPCCECTHGTAFNGTICIDESRCPCKVNGDIKQPDETWTDEEDKCLVKSK